jgi:hypothetical protein
VSFKGYIFLFFLSHYFYVCHGLDFIEERLPIKELSGSTYDSVRDLIWFNSDSGHSKDELIYSYGRGSEDLISYNVVGFKNIDWEAIDLDESCENIYIFDIGNNYSKRSSLRIAKVPIDLESNILSPIEVHEFHSPLDFEAGFIRNDNLFLINKSYFGPVNIFHLDLSENELIKGINLDIRNVTDSEIFDDKLFILSYSSIYLSKKKINSFSNGQSEALTVIGEKFYVTNESGRTVILEKKSTIEKAICLISLLLILAWGIFENLEKISPSKIIFSK